MDHDPPPFFFRPVSISLKIFFKGTVHLIMKLKSLSNLILLTQQYLLWSSFSRQLVMSNFSVIWHIQRDSMLCKSRALKYIFFFFHFFPFLWNVFFIYWTTKDFPAFIKKTIDIIPPFKIDLFVMFSR